MAAATEHAAAVEAHLYHPARIVTVAMDKIEFKEPVFVGDVVSFFTETARIGRTSITIRVDVWAQRAANRRQFAHVAATAKATRKDAIDCLQ